MPATTCFMKSNGHRRVFVEEMRVAKYNAAIETHKRCDSISMALITGMLAISGFSVSLYNSIRSDYASSIGSNGVAPYIFLASDVIVIILCLMYRKSSDDARVARNVARELESEHSDGRPYDGISYVLYNMAPYTPGSSDEKERVRKDYRSSRPPLLSTSIYRLVNYLAFVLVFFLTAAFCMLR